MDEQARDLVERMKDERVAPRDDRTRLLQVLRGGGNDLTHCEKIA